MLIHECPCCGMAMREVNDAASPLASAFGLACFREGRFLDDRVASGVAQ